MMFNLMLSDFILWQSRNSQDERPMNFLASSRVLVVDTFSSSFLFFMLTADSHVSWIHSRKNASLP
jgi:hypothetical protein